VEELLQADLLKRAFAIEREDLDRYLYLSELPSVNAPQTTMGDAVAGTQRILNVWVEHRKRPRRQAENMQDRNCRSYPRNQKWDSDS
jgi:hypothetical protein